MVFKLKKKKTECGDFYKIIGIEDKSEKTIELVNNLIFIMGDFDSDYLDSFPMGQTEGLGAYICKTEMVDDGDYNFDDEWEPNYKEARQFFPCNFCPLTGVEIKFEVVEEEDLVFETKKLLNDISNLNKKHTKKADLERKELEEKLNRYTSNDISLLFE